MTATADFDFSMTDIPSDAAPEGMDFTAPPSDDPTCAECGAPLSYSGRGRKPKYCDDHKGKRTTASGGTRRGSGDVETAVQSLHTLYDTLCYPLAAVSLPAAQAWNAQIEDLDNRNRTFLATNKDLVKKINGAAAKGGTSAFVLSHVVAFLPVAMILRTDLAAKSAAKRQAREAQTGGDHFTDNPVTDPDAVFAAQAASGL